MTNGGTHRGWKAIAKRLGYSDLDSVQRQVKKLKIPVVKYGRTAVLDEAVYRFWYLENYKVALENKSEITPPKSPQQAPSKPPQQRVPKKVLPV